MPGGNGFDPSREWIGISAVDLADPFRALGLSATDADAAAVNTAAARLLGRLREIDPGPFRLAHESLQRRLEACRSEALAAIVARAPPVPPAPRPEAPDDVSNPDDVSTAVDEDVSTAEDDPPPDADIVLRGRPRRPSASGSAMPAIFSAIVAIAAGVAAYAFWPKPGEKVRKPPAPPINVVVVQPALTNQVSTGAPARPTDPRVQSREHVRPAASPESPLPATPPEPVSPPTPAQPTRAERARVAAAVDRALREAHASLRRGEFDAADRKIAMADRLAEDDEPLADRVASWQLLAVHARRIPEFRDRALKAARGDYDVGRVRVAVIESTPQVFKYRSAGVTQRLHPADVPRPIVNAIMRAWFAGKNQPGNHVFLGCDLLLLDTPDTAAAAQEWRLAKQGGENVALLEPLLRDPIIREAARQ